MSRITPIDVVDLRVPPSDTLLGSDPFHKKPNYSTGLTKLRGWSGLRVTLWQGREASGGLPFWPEVLAPVSVKRHFS